MTNCRGLQRAAAIFLWARFALVQPVAAHSARVTDPAETAVLDGVSPGRGQESFSPQESRTCSDADRCGEKDSRPLYRHPSKRSLVGMVRRG